MRAVILAGGGGTRLWPVSRKRTPKQVQSFMGGKTLLQATYDRLRRAFSPEHIYISSNIHYLSYLQKQLPRVHRRQYILEPVKRDTAPAIGLAAVTIAKRFPKETMFIANSDYYIKNVLEFARYIKLSDRALRRKPNYTVLVGLKPTYPETGLGYVKISKVAFEIGEQEVFYGERFIEKPDLKTAKQYFERWDYLWNTAMFSWRVDHLLELFRKHLPRHFTSLMKIKDSLGTKREASVVRREFHSMPAISIDYGMMEKTKQMLVLPADFDWVDIGHWRTVQEVLAEKKGKSVVAAGRHVSIDSRGNYIYSASGKLIATISVQNMIIVETEDAILVCPRDKAQDVKQLVALLEKRGLKKYV